MHFRDSQLPYHHIVYNYLLQEDFTGLSNFLQEHTEFLTPTGLTQNPMLHLAARYGSNRMAQILHEQLGKQARVLAKCQVGEGWTPLHLAAVYGHPELMRTLIDILGEEAPAAIAIPLNDNTQATVLHLAMSEGKTEIVKILLKGCGDKVVDIAGLILADEWTALHLVVHCGDSEMVAALLQAIGRDNAKLMATRYLKSGMNILHLTATSGDEEITDLMLDLLDDDMLYELGQAKVGELDDAIPLNLAVQHGLTSLFKRLLIALREKAKPLCLTRMANGWDAFLQISYFGNVEMLRAIIQTLGKDEARRQIMEPFSRMRNATPFHMVLNRGNVAMTKVMIAAVDKEYHEELVNLQQSDGMRPMVLAKRFMNDDLLDLLVEISPVTS